VKEKNKYHSLFCRAKQSDLVLPLPNTQIKTNKQTQWDRTAHLIGGVLAVGLGLSGSTGHGPRSDITEIDLTLWGGATSRLAPNNDGTARQDLREMTKTTSIEAIKSTVKRFVYATISVGR